MTKQLINNGIPDYGMFPGSEFDPNLLDTKNIWNMKTPGFFKKFRLKEWEAFQIWSPVYFVFGAVYNAKITGVIILSVYNTNSGKLIHSSRKVLPVKINIAKHLSGTISNYLGKLLKIEISNDKDYFEINSKSKTIKLRVKGKRKSNSLTVCLPLGKNRSIYSHKCLVPISGSLNIRGNNEILNPEDSQLIVDHHKGFYPYKLSYDWSTASWRENGILIGFNLTRNQVINPEKFNENCLWYGDIIIMLPVVRYTFHKNYWHIQSKCGNVNICFYPKVDNSIRFNAGIISANYKAPYGDFEGEIIAKSNVFKIKKAFGVGEIKRYRM